MGLFLELFELLHYLKLCGCFCDRHTYFMVKFKDEELKLQREIISVNMHWCLMSHKGLECTYNMYAYTFVSSFGEGHDF